LEPAQDTVILALVGRVCADPGPRISLSRKWLMEPACEIGQA
jgi:hypothetical protein